MDNWWHGIWVTWETWCDLGNMMKQHVCSFLVMHWTSEPSETMVEIDWFIHQFFHFLLSSPLLSCCAECQQSQWDCNIACQEYFLRRANKCLSLIDNNGRHTWVLFLVVRSCHLFLLAVHELIIFILPLWQISWIAHCYLCILLWALLWGALQGEMELGVLNARILVNVWGLMVTVMWKPVLMLWRGREMMQ